MSKPKWCLLTTVAVLSALLVAPPASAAADPPISDPIPDNPVASQLALTLTEFAQFPKSDPVPPTPDPRIMRHARINYLGELPDGSGRMYVPDLNGMLYLVRNGVPQPYLDVFAAIGPDFWSHRGLGSGFGFVAFHPDFKRNGLFYTVHTEARDALLTKTPDLTPQVDSQVHSVVTEWTATNPAANTFSGTHREVMRLGYRNTFHDMQQIAFNPTAGRHDEDYGLLYIASGDGGRGTGSTDPQTLDNPYGKILRIDPRGTDGPNARYGIPRTNPFVGQAGARGEIYAIGLRDPHRFSWDTQLTWDNSVPGRPRLRHRMWLGHIGEHNIESIVDVLPGDNFGWTKREGAFTVRDPDPQCGAYPLPADDAQFGFVYPLAAYDHDRPVGSPPCADQGYAVIGGFVYRGNALPALRGKYVFGEGVRGNLYFTEPSDMRRGKKRAQIFEFQVLDRTGKRVTVPDLAGDTRVDLRFGTDNRGELYVLAKANGKIWKVTGARKVPLHPEVLPSLQRNLAAYYDFDHPLRGIAAREVDQGRSGTDVSLINGGAAMRVNDGAFPASRGSIQLQQVNPTTAGNDDWKAGVYSAGGVPTLNAFNGARGSTVMGWFKMTGQNPSPNSGTADPNDVYGAVGLAGVLSGGSDGHAVRGLLELIEVNGVLKVVALGRRVDGGASQTFAARDPWPTILPPNEWVFLAATFDFSNGTMALYKNGRRLAGSYVVPGDPWGVAGPGRHRASATDPSGIKIGGSFPQNTSEANPCNCRMDSLMFLNKAASSHEVWQQYRQATTARP
jgi:glucose/arabinose dehydrogenase